MHLVLQLSVFIKCISASNDAGNPSRSKDMKDHVEQGLALAGMLVVLVGVMFAAAAALT
jgi:hypothetical protein